MIGTETATDKGTTHCNPYEDPELLDRANGDDEYKARLVAADLARRHMEASPYDPGVLEAKQRMDAELIDFEYRTGRRLPPAETD